MNDTSADTQTELTPAQLSELVAAGAELIDVRRPYEFEAGHLEGARNIELNDVPAAAESLSRVRPLVFICRTGNRSSMAVAAYREAGFDAYNLAEGVEGWVRDGQPLEPADGVVKEPLPPS